MTAVTRTFGGMVVGGRGARARLWPDEALEYPLVLFDLDGTLCDTSGRSHLIPNWVAYSKACGDDGVLELGAHIGRSFAARHGLVLVTGRQDEARDETVEWLYNQGIQWSWLAMRPAGNLVKNQDLKAAFLDALLAGGYRVAAGVEDHPLVADEYLKRGVPVALLRYPYTSDAGADRDLEKAEPAADLPRPVQDALDMVLSTFRKKGADYTEDGDWRSNFDSVARATGITPATVLDVMLAVKQSRLAALKANGREPANESVLDTKLDRAVYSLLSLAEAIDSCS